MKSSEKGSNFRSKQRSQHSFAATVVKNTCPQCNADHTIYQCDEFKALIPAERFEAAKKNKLCINCLRSNHRVLDCTGSPCRKCKKRHNVLLHFEKKAQASNASETASQSECVLSHMAQASSEGLLATAIVDLFNDRGESKTCRAFLDAGSQANFITEVVASHLRLQRKIVDISVSGVDNISTRLKHSVSATLKSRHSRYEKRLEFLVLNRVTKTMPSISINRTTLEIPQNINLADPEFYKPSDINILIGVKLFYKLLSVGQISLKNHPDAVLQKTQLGWIVAGEINNSLSNNVIHGT